MSITVTRDLLYTTSADGRRRHLDVYRPHLAGPVSVALLWHGSGADEKDMLAPLAEEAAGNGLLVFVPDWDPTAADRGRADLLASLDYMRSRAARFDGATDRSVVAGWSAGAGAAVGLALSSRYDGWRPSAVVGVAGRYDVPARSTGTVPMDDLLEPPASPTPVHLVHGTGDTAVPALHSRELLEALRDRGRPASLTEPDTDHAGAVMTEFDPGLGRCRRSRCAHAVRAGQQTARVLAQAAVSGA
ncbi:alpha/beta hydrolase [Streptomyces sp. NPDC005907]|uniref:alpha/beta hydrolase family protein n=1 Tax=Streptomyces sp. NPDC005907 TaxID=3154571 RepID=UPI00340F9CF8